ncbi:hypothetical protein P0136_08405 [Lentisphaerota bacterium ZTH]|nr:hypothetical protein P0136_08405 [Lentisphaerota bacterium ZTH]
MQQFNRGLDGRIDSVKCDCHLHSPGGFRSAFHDLTVNSQFR